MEEKPLVEQLNNLFQKVACRLQITYQKTAGKI